MLLFSNTGYEPLLTVLGDIQVLHNAMEGGSNGVRADLHYARLWSIWPCYNR